MFVEKRRDTILKKLFLDVSLVLSISTFLKFQPSDYHDLYSTDAMSVLCAYGKR